MKRFRVIECLLGIAILASAGSAFAQGPVLFFSDLESGPNAGGQNNKGVFVTLYGANFGSAQGASTVTVGGGAVDHCPVWGASWMWYQKITCQLGSGAATGNIVVTVNGQASNGLPFTVRKGNIYFVDNKGGSDRHAGSFAGPWKSIIYAKNHISDGDTVYLRAGTWTDIDAADGASGLVMSAHGGSSGSPRAFLGYPGEAATIACSPPSSQCDDIRSVTGPAGWLVFAELDLGANKGTHYIIDWENGGGGDGIRWIGNKIHGAYAVNVVLQGSMNGSYFLGNDDYDYWSLAHGGGTNERGYGLYYGGYGTQQNISIQYNRFWNDQGPGISGNLSTSGTAVTWVSGDKFLPSMVGFGIGINNTADFVVSSVTDSTHLVLASSAGTQTSASYFAGGVSTKGLQIYGHCPHDCSGTNDYFKNVTIANNQALDNCMEGMAVGGTDGGTVPWQDSGILAIYNNLIVNNGACDNINAQTYSGLQLGDGYGGMNAKVFNNTFYLNAGGAIGHQRAGDIYIFPTKESFEISNNIFYAQPSGSAAYTTFIYLDGSGGTLSGAHNLFFSNGNRNAVAPGWATGTVSTSAPEFVNPSTNPVTADFHLRANSPARNTGATVGLVTSDLAGAARPQESAYDVGAYEFGSGGAAHPR